MSHPTNIYILNILNILLKSKRYQKSLSNFVFFCVEVSSGKKTLNMVFEFKC